MNIFANIDNIEKLHQELKKEYFKWAFKRKDKGVGSKNNPLTLKFIDKNLSFSLKNQISKELATISNFLKTNDNLIENYQILKEIYIIAPSFHEMWFFKNHFNTNLKSILKGRLGIKAFLTSKKKGNLNKNIKGITSFILKRTILLENLFSPVLKMGLMETKSSKNIERDIHILINKKISTPNEVLRCLPILFKISHHLLEKQEYSLLKSGVLIGKNSWLKYAPCAINEGPVFFKKLNKRRIEIFKEIPSLQENKIRALLLKNFKIKEVLK